MRNTDRLDLKVQRPTPEQVFAADQLRKLAAEFEAIADREDTDDAWPWTRAAAKATCRARDLDGDEFRKARIQLTAAEAIALSDLMDEHPDCSYGMSWRTGRSGAIDWETFELVVSASADAGGHVPEAITWLGAGGRAIPPLLMSVRTKIEETAVRFRNS